MKSAEEWAAIIDSDDDDEKDAFAEKYPTFADMIRAVQADAVKACAEYLQDRSTYNHEVAKQMSRGDHRELEFTRSQFAGTLGLELSVVKHQLLKNLLPQEETQSGGNSG